MSDTVILALVVAFPAVVTSVMVVLGNRANVKAARLAKVQDAEIRKEEKQQDYARADLIEERHSKEAKQLLDRQDVLAKKADEAAGILKTNTAAAVKASDDAMKASAETQGRLQQIHTLVNSNLTAEMKARLAAMQAGLASLLEIVDLRKSLGHSESEGAATLIKSTRAAIDELVATLDERLKATDVAAAEKATASIAATAATITAAATAAATAAITSNGPLEVTIKQDEDKPVPVKQSPPKESKPE